MADDVLAPGWDSIDDALRAVYGDVEPQHYGTIIKWCLGGPDPLDGVSFYRSEIGVPHWHVISFGFSELYGKESDDPTTSGFGFELTIRVARPPGEAGEPPIWAANLLQNLARYVFSSGNVFGPGDHLNLNGPILAGGDTELCGGLFVADPELPARDTPNGRLEFLQVVGITSGELEAVRRWNGEGFASVLRDRVPRLVTDLRRRSILEDPATRQLVAERTEEEGSSMAALYIDRCSVAAGDGPAGGTVLHLGTIVVPSIIMMLRGRIPRGKPFFLRSRATDAELLVRFSPADRPSLAADAEGLVVHLDTTTALELAAVLAPEPGRYRSESFLDLCIELTATEIKDRDGNVVRTIR